MAATPWVTALVALAGCLHPEPGGATTPLAAAPAVQVAGGGAEDVDVEAGAGFAIVHTPWPQTLVRLETPQGQRHYGPAASPVTVGFLTPGTPYRFEARADAPDGPTVTGSFTTLPGAAWGTGEARPGSYVGIGISHCSMAFLLRDARNQTLYTTTAGHCVAEDGQAVLLLDSVHDVVGQRLGEVVLRGGASAEDFGDWALIRVDAAARPLLDPAVRHWGGPTSAFAFPAADDGLACHVGWGAALGWTEPTSPRCAHLLGPAADAAGVLQFSGLVSHGDSGSPAIEYATGRALGMVVRSNYGQDFGALSVCHLLQRFHAAGYDLALATAPYAPPEPTAIQAGLLPSLSPLADTPAPCPANILQGYWP